MFTRDQIPAAWPELEPFVLEALKMARGELTAEHVRGFLEQGIMVAFAGVRKKKIEMVLIAEIVIWPVYKSIRIVALSGKNFRDYSKEFMDDFKAWAFAVDAVELEALVSERMARFLRHLGFYTAYRLVRMDLRGKLQ